MQLNKQFNPSETVPSVIKCEWWNQNLPQCILLVVDIIKEKCLHFEKHHAHYVKIQTLHGYKPQEIEGRNKADFRM